MTAASTDRFRKLICTAATQASDALFIPDKGIVSIEGTGVMTIDLQYLSRYGNWVTVDTKTATGRYVFDGGGGVPWRLYCSAYTSGTYNCSISMGDRN